MGSVKIEREPNTIYTLSLSYGKDSLACLGAIEQLGLPLDRIVHAEVWATQDIPADLPPMVEFKAKADEIIYQRYGIRVEHFYALTKNGDKATYEDYFYTTQHPRDGKHLPHIYGFPMQRTPWCNSRLKIEALGRAAKVSADSKRIAYLGIAADETERVERHEKKEDIILPLVMAGWDEAYCRKWCEERDLLSPIYTTSARGGCWFCHNQGVDQLRLLRKTYPDLWERLLQWDKDSQIIFKPNGHTVNDYDKRFAMEDKGVIHKEDTFRWDFLDNAPNRQMRIDEFL